jgi:hypothetical protein
MRRQSNVLLLACILLGQVPYTPLRAQKAVDKFAAKPLFRDSIYDGAADPVVIWNKAEKKWFMFYTNRRAKADSLDGVKWVHGTRIGIAESGDNGVTWHYRDTADIQFRPVKDYTHWAPEVIEHKGLYHMYLTYVPGVFSDWKHPRDIIHLTSKNLLAWKYESTLKLASDRVIDACVFSLPNGHWRMYYNNERDSKSIYFADSEDLYHWKDGTKVIGDKAGEGPKVFKWKKTHWMIVDNWKGLGVYSSDDLAHWKRQEGNLLEQPGKGVDDQVIGGHPDVVVSGNRAFLFYFTHPGRQPGIKADTYEQRRSSLQVTELQFDHGKIICDRDLPCSVALEAKIKR